MDQFEQEIEHATKRAAIRLQREPRAVAAHYDADRGRIVIDLNTGYSVSFPAARAQGLEHASPAALAEIKITPSGYGLHFPKLDADLWVPALLEGVFGSRAWMAAQLGAKGGKATSEAKAQAARINGARGGRPLKRAAKKVGRPLKWAAKKAVKCGLVKRAKPKRGVKALKKPKAPMNPAEQAPRVPRAKLAAKVAKVGDEAAAKRKPAKRRA
jgi:hypothetical protein